MTASQPVVLQRLTAGLPVKLQSTPGGWALLDPSTDRALTEFAGSHDPEASDWYEACLEGVRAGQVLDPHDLAGTDLAELLADPDTHVRLVVNHDADSNPEPRLPELESDLTVVARPVLTDRAAPHQWRLAQMLPAAGGLRFYAPQADGSWSMWSEPAPEVTTPPPGPQIPTERRTRAGYAAPVTQGELKLDLASYRVSG